MPDKKTYLSDIKRRIRGAGPLPWKLEMKTVDTQFGIFDLPVAIKAPEREIVSEYDGLLYGWTPDSKNSINKQVSFLVNSRLDVEALLRAVEICCGDDTARIEMVLEFARKEILQNHGLLPDPAILYVEGSGESK